MSGRAALREAPAPRPDRPPPAPTSVMRQRILDAAAALLHRRSYEATTVRAIAEAAGIKAGSLYHHFASKDAIVACVVDEGVRVVHEAVCAALAALPPDAGPRAQLQAAAQAHLVSSLRHGDYTSASLRSFAHLPPAVRRNCAVRRRRYEAVWAGIVEASGEAGLLPPHLSRDVVRLALLGAVNWAGEWYRPGPLSIERIARDLAELALGPRPPAPQPGARP